MTKTFNEFLTSRDFRDSGWSISPAVREALIVANIRSQYGLIIWGNQHYPGSSFVSDNKGRRQPPQKLWWEYLEWSK
jgi:hypothetical protein